MRWKQTRRAAEADVLHLGLCWSSCAMPWDGPAGQAGCWDPAPSYCALGVKAVLHHAVSIQSTKEQIHGVTRE